MRRQVRQVRRGVRRFLRTSRTLLHELQKTVEPFFPLADTLIVRGLLIYLLLEKAKDIVQQP